MIQQAFASPEEALAHYGKKGMRWGVRKETDAASMAKTTELGAEFLDHHGVKGMKWGVRNEDEPVGRDASGKISGTGSTGRDSSGKISGTGSTGRNASGKISGTGSTGRDSSGKISSNTGSAKAAEYNRLASKIADRAGVDSNLAAAKYGPPEMVGASEKQRQADREKLKKVAIGVGLGVGVAGLGIAAYKLNQSGFDLDKLPTDQAKLRELMKTSAKAYKNPVDGLHINWDKGVDLPKGATLRRLSSVAETTPRPDGFFAAHLDNDVESYKAILPTFWERWGVGSAETGGFLNHYMAKEEIRAPSGKESFEMFKKLIHTDDSFNEHFVSFWDARGARGKSDEELKKLFVDSSMNWADPTKFTKHWFKAVKSNGYNALIDFNDAGKLGKTPLRVIDGTLFDIVKNEPQSLNDFYTAAKGWSPELVHIFVLANDEIFIIHVDEFLRIAEMGSKAISSGRIDLQKGVVERR